MRLECRASPEMSCRPRVEREAAARDEHAPALATNARRVRQQEEHDRHSHRRKRAIAKRETLRAGKRDLCVRRPLAGEVHQLSDGQRLGAWQVLWTPGHDPEHICLCRSADRVLLCGDLPLPGYTPNVQPSWDGRDALADFEDSLRRIAALPISLVLPAHGGAYRDAAARSAEPLAHHARRLAVLRHRLAAGPATLDELCDAAFGSPVAAPADAMLAALEAYAHLDHLGREGEVGVGDGWAWTLAA